MAAIDLPVTLLDLAGSAALLLWGVHMVQTGVQRASGARLRVFLATRLRRRLPAFLAGLGVTALLQSSTATGLMVAGYAADGLVGLVPALAAMLGANVGTTLIVQLVSFHVARLAPVLILAGVVLFRRSSSRRRDFSRVLIGLGLLLMALEQFTTLLTPLADEPNLRLLLGAIADRPALDVLVGAMLAWGAHSSVAVVLLAMGFAAEGTVSPDAAFALVLGANLGTSVNPVLEGGRAGSDPASRRLPVGNLLTRIGGIALVLPALGPVGILLVRLEPDNARAVADFHTVFNLAVALLLFPLLDPFATLLRRLLPARVDEADPSRPLYLDRSALEMPVVALGHAAREALRLVDLLLSMLDLLERGLLGGRKATGGGRRLEAVIERLDDAIKDYVAAIDTDAMSDADEARARAVLTFAIRIELAAGVMERSLLAIAARRLKRGLVTPPEAEAALAQTLARVRRNAGTAASVFMTGDRSAADALVGEKATVRAIEARATDRHMQLLRERTGEAASASRDGSELALEAIAELKRVNTLLIAASAYPILDQALPSEEGRVDLPPDDDDGTEPGPAAFARATGDATPADLEDRLG